MGKGLIKAYEITVKDFERTIKFTPWYKFGLLLSLKYNLNYFKDQLEKARAEDKEYEQKGKK